MTSTAERLTAPDLLADLRAQRAVRDAAEVQILLLASGWADRHTVDPAKSHVVAGSFLEQEHPSSAPDPDEEEWRGLPTLRWDTAASLAAALGLSTTGGRALIRDALVLRHRLPRVWAHVLAGEVATWRARRIAQAVLGSPDDVCAYLDARLADRAGQIGPVLLDRAIDEAMLRLHPEEREIAQLEELDRRYATLLEASINHTGVADYAIRGDWADLAAFDDAVTDVAAALARNGCDEPLDVRRSMACGVLADPARAQSLLSRERTSQPAPKPKRRVVLNLDLSAGNLAGLDPVVLDTEGRARLEDLVREWCGRPDVKVWVRPVRHCGGCVDCPAAPEPTAYRPAPFTREDVERRDRHCVFPYCTRPATSCDADHIVAFDHDQPDHGGPTSRDNLALLCRHHHRLKTHAAWTYTTIEPAVYLWADRYGQQFIRTRDGTSDLTRYG